MRRFAAVLAAFALAVLLGTVIPWPISTPLGGPKPLRIHAATGAIHSDVVVRLDDEIRARFAFLAKAGLDIANPDMHWLAFGWGGRSFYLSTPTWSDVELMPVLRALTLDAAAMHVTMVSDLGDFSGDVIAIDIDAEQHAAILAAIEDGFTSGLDGPIPIPDSSYGPNDVFFEADGTFNALIGCNTWAAAVLRAGGVRTGLWNPLPQTLAASLRLFNKTYAPGSDGSQP